MEDKILCNVSDLEPIADAVREKENTNKLYSVEELKVKVPELIGSGGIELPVLTNPATMIDVVVGKEFINGEGNKVTGTNPYEKTTTDAQVAEIEGLIEELNAALDGKSGSDAAVKTCTVTFRQETSKGTLVLNRYSTYNGEFFSYDSGFTAWNTSYSILLTDDIGEYILENVVVGSYISISAIGSVPVLTLTGNYEHLPNNESIANVKVLGDLTYIFRDDD